MVAEVCNCSGDAGSNRMDEDLVERSVAKEEQIVRRLLLAQFLISSVNGWTFGSIFDVDLYVISAGSNSFVGLAESVKGLTGLFLAVPLGYLADRWPRVRVLKATAVCGVPTAIVVGFGLLSQSKACILVGTVMFAVVMQSFSGAVPALVADLTTPGAARARAMGWQVMAVQLGMSAGSLVQLALLLSVGAQSSWSPNLLGASLATGLVLLVLSMSVILSLPGVEDVHSADQRRQEPNRSSIQAGTDDTVAGWSRGRIFGGRLEVKWAVVALLELTFVLSLLATGMSVKYFPLFFKQDFDFGPAGICALNAAFPLFVTAVIPVCIRLSGHLGQVPGILILSSLGTGFLFLLARCTDTRAAVVVFLLRNAFMKSRDPLFQALLMDCLDKRHRGRFGAVTSVRTATWAGSAWIGGLILDHHDSNYRLIFDITSAVMLVPLALTLPLLLIVPLKVSQARLVDVSGPLPDASARVSDEEQRSCEEAEQ